MYKVEPICALRDNYIWALSHPKNDKLWIVDPGEAAPVLHTLDKQQKILEGILVTHHHWDHTGGIEALLNTFPHIQVIGSNHNKTSFINKAVGDHASVSIESLETTFHVIDIPGHTLDHIAFYDDHSLFCGDTLFSNGCGRVFEGTFPQMYDSLMTIKHLPPTLAVYCAHEYTESNCQFALTVDPENTSLKARLASAKKLRQNGEPTIPSLLSDEIKTNPFLRCDYSVIKEAAEAHVGRTLLDATDVFMALRQWKDCF